MYIFLGDTREWQFKDDKIIIKDSLNKTAKAVAKIEKQSVCNNISDKIFFTTRRHL